MATPLVHPRLLGALASAGFFPSTCAIQRSALTQDATGQPALTWSTIPGFESVPCRVAPASSGTRMTGLERRRPDMTVAAETHHILLAGASPSLRPWQRVVLSDTGAAHDILAVETDSQGATTRLRTELVTV